MSQLVIIRHGQSIWNLENRFTGWADVELTDRGIEQAATAGRLLKQHGFTFDIAFTSVLNRCIQSLWLMLAEMDLMWIPSICDWRLNERHYGGLTGLNKEETALKIGREQVHLWRRSYSATPPPMPRDQADALYEDRRYAGVNRDLLPVTESLEDTVARVLPFWEKVAEPALLSGKRVLINAHGNSIRALMKYLEDIPEEAIPDLHIANSSPIVYEFSNSTIPLQRRILKFDV